MSDDTKSETTEAVEPETKTEEKAPEEPKVVAKPEEAKPAYSALWTEKVGAFAKSIGVTLEDATTTLTPIVGDPNDEGVETLIDPECMTNQMFRDALTGVPVAKLNKAIKNLRGSAAPVTAPVAATAAAVPPTYILPEAPEDEAFLSSLKVGGVAKIGATELNAALRVLLAQYLDVYNLPSRLLAMMEEHAESLDEPVGEQFYDLQKIVSEHKYGEVLAALGTNAKLVSETRKKKLLSRMGSLWPTLHNFHLRLSDWMDLWQKQFTNPGMMMSAMAAMTSGGRAPGMPGMMEHPDISPIHDSACSTIDAFNKMFAGTGIPVARAMAHDSLRIKNMLQDTRLPAAIGASNRDEMLKKLGVAVSSDYVRLERDLVTFVLSIMKFAADGVPTESHPVFLNALFQRGTNIPWERLVGTTSVHRDGSPARDAQRY